MELVRFDAYRTDEGTALAGVWAKSDTQHDFEPVLDVAQFETEHADRSDSDHRQRLVHLAVWQDVSNFKVAAIWRHPPAGELSSEFWQPDIVLFGLTWSDLETAPAESYYLDDIEVYTVPIGGAPKVAAVWRPGALETEVLAGTHCHIGDEPLRSSQLNGNKDLPCEIEGSTTPSAMAKSSCPVLQQVYDIAKTAMDAGEKSFLRPFDFEKYVEGGETHLAVLLQKRENKDWLMLPGAWDAVDCRHTLFDLDDELGFSESRLLDLDLVGVEGHHFGDALHEGVVHDSGTSGPPGGS
jgi:hypothetical protein